jgi:hypothetical protein
VDDGDHYVDGLVEVRKFFAGLAMTIMLRERLEVDFVDLKGKTLNDFYMDNLDLKEGDPGTGQLDSAIDQSRRCGRGAGVHQHAGPGHEQFLAHPLRALK